jgi:hypothetical protein
MSALPRIIVAVGVTILSGCQPQATNAPVVQLPSVIVVAPGATDVCPQRSADGQVGVSYKVREQFPADAMLARIRAALPTSEWRPLPEDWLNPGVPSSHHAGWSTFEDGTKTPSTEVKQWFAQWQDTEGNVVLYMLRYDSTFVPDRPYRRAPDNSDLSVSGLWIPAVVAEQAMAKPGGS